MGECAWFKCRTAFQRKHHLERFCSRKCQGRESNWRAMRGKPMVALLMVWRASRNWSKAQRLAWEAEHNRPVPGITDIARLVDAMTAEQKNYTP